MNGAMLNIKEPRVSFYRLPFHCTHYCVAIMFLCSNKNARKLFQEIVCSIKYYGKEAFENKNTHSFYLLLLHIVFPLTLQKET